jgi:hypothetical protein
MMGLSGPIALILLALMWTSGMQPQAIAIVSGALLIWLLLGAPTVCGAETRDGSPCRKNANGIIRGCDIRQHGRQKRQRMFGRDRDSQLSMTVSRSASRQVSRRRGYGDLGVRAKYVIDVAGALGSCVSGVVALATLVL